MEKINMSPDKVKVSIIPNDLTQDIEKVLQMCEENGIHYVELASMWHKSIFDLTEEEENKLIALMDKYGVKASAIQTQIMKVDPPSESGTTLKPKGWHTDYEFNISHIDRAIELAKKFDTKYIISYSFRGKKHHDKATQEKNWQLMFKTYESFLPKLKESGKTMCIECDGGQYIGSIDDHLRLFEHFNSPHIMANFDLANLYHVQTFEREDFERFYKWVPYFHVKDRKISTGWKAKLLGHSRPAVFGEGNIPWRKVIPWFVEKGFSGFLSVEPHVGGNRFERGKQCALNLQKMLRELNIDFE